MNLLQNHSALPLLSGGLIGLEKESLRVSKAGGISEALHPVSLGSALTHPYITTDYSEALTEFITPPLTSIDGALDFLCDTQAYVYRHLQGEALWATSMPCIVAGDEGIPIAEYGLSNAGLMKHIYRLGLGYRYGRVMQVIAGVHFNFSVEEALWPLWQDAIQVKGELRDFKDERYMGMIRNLQRYGWLIPYLFGASPAVCKSFFSGKGSRLEVFDASTYYEPYATSLRMGDIGYQNRKEEGVGVKANYDTLASYVESLKHAIETPALIWEEIGVKVDGEYRQLNANILQIENEYYSTVRPKQILDGMEKPIQALSQRGIRYVELRSLDVNAYHPLGVDGSQLHFLKAFMVFCLLQDSPRISLRERVEIDRNILTVAHRGREPNLMLSRQGGGVSLKQWARQILTAMTPLSKLMDESSGHYLKALKEQQAKVEAPELTPSARMLAEMRENGECFYQFARRMSAQHQQYYSQRELPQDREKLFKDLAVSSQQQQRELERKDQGDFDGFLAEYLAQR